MTTPVRTKPTRPLSIRGQVLTIVFAIMYIISIEGHPTGLVQFKSVEIDDIKSASRAQFQHLKRVAIGAQCSKPRERVIHMHDLITDPGAKFIPECTTLHRCGDDTGCCPAGYTCAPRDTDEVTMVFQVYRMNPNGLPKITTDAFQFVNHTQCGCVEKNDIPK